MTRFRTTIVSVLTVGFLAVSAQAAEACTDTWYGGNPSSPGSGSWETAGDWSTGAVPSGSDDVCITIPGDYTVTLAPQTDTELGDGVNSLTLGGTSGSQTLDISGEGAAYRGDQYNQTTLTVSGATTISGNGTLVLDATGQTASGTTVGSGANAGGGSAAFDGNVANYGRIVAQSEDSSWREILSGGLTNEPGGNLSVNSGSFNENQASPYNWSGTNDGTITIASNATFDLTPSFAGTAEFTNDGSVVNNGSVAANATGGGMTWTQSGGSISGNAVALQNGTALVDSAGTGAFLADNAAATITGTIPAGQTVTVQGEHYSYQGNEYESTSLSLNGSTLVNDGTLALEAPGSGSGSGGSVFLTDGTIQNHGTINAAVQDAAWAIHLQAALANAHGASVSVSGGSFDQDNGTPTTNDGLLTLAPGAVYLLDEGAAFTNESDGVLSPEIASAASVGSFQLASPCCNGSGVFTAGGTLAPSLIGGFVPAAGEDFPLVAISGTFGGKFAAVSNGFSGDYTHDTSSPAYFGAIYGKGAGAGGAVAKLRSASGADGKIKLRFSCPAGGSACGSVKVIAKVTEHLKRGKITRLTASNKKGGGTTKQVVVAASRTTLAAGTSKTLTLKLNSTGRALLKRFGKFTVAITATSAGKTVDRVSVGVRQTKKKRR